MESDESEAFSKELARLTRALSNAEPRGQYPFTVIPDAGVPYVPGTTLPVISRDAFQRRREADLVEPAGVARETSAPYLTAFVMQSDYLDADATDAELEARSEAWSVHSPREELITALCTVNLCAGDRSDLVGELVEVYASQLQREVADKLRAILAQTDPPRRFLARQAVLKALRLVLLAPEGDANVGAPAVVKAIVLSHCVAQLLDRMPSTVTPFSGNVSAELAVTVVQNYLFHRHQDVYMRIQRTDELWRIHGQTVDKSALGKTADALLEEATGGLSRRDIFALGFGMVAHAMQWKPGQPPACQPPKLVNAGEDLTGAALEFLSATPTELGAKLSAASAEWSLEPFEEAPVLHIPAGFLVVDMPLLLNRITSCLADVVYEHLAHSTQPGDAILWSREYGRMVERLVLAYAGRLAPALIGGGRAHYGESDLKAAVAGGRSCDVVIDFGDAMLLIEAQRGEVPAEVRYEGEVARLLRHIQNAVISKAEQLDGVARFLIEDERPLTGLSQARSPIPMLWPVIVQGDGFSVEPVTQTYIREQIRAKGWLDHPRIGRLSVIDADELQMLVGLFEWRGLTPPHILAEWHESDHDLYSLRNFLLHAYAEMWPDAVRPKGAEAIGDALMDDVVCRLGLTTDPPATPGGS